MCSYAFVRHMLKQYSAMRLNVVLNLRPTFEHYTALVQEKLNPLDSIYAIIQKLIESTPKVA